MGEPKVNTRDFLSMEKSDFEKIGIRGTASWRSAQYLIREGVGYFYPRHYSKAPFYISCKKYDDKTLLKTKHYDSLDDFDIEDYIAMGFSPKTIRKFEWLRDWVNGEIDGAYEEDADEEIEAMIEAYSKIRELNNIIAKQEEKIAEQRDKIERQNNILRTVKKLKQAITEFESE